MKADAYGLGATRMASTMHRLGIRRFAAYGLAEAIEVADAAPGAEVIVLMPVRELEGRPESGLAGSRAAPLHGPPAKPGRGVGIGCRPARGRPSPAPGVRLRHGSRWMHRVGCDGRARIRREESPSSFGRGDDPSPGCGRRSDLRDRARPCLRTDDRRRRPLVSDDVVRHVAATASLESGSLHFDQARVGLAWVGHGPRVLAGRPDPMPLRPILSWWSRIVQVRRLAAGSTVGYGCTFVTTRKTITGLVPVGYADGLPATPDPSRIGSWCMGSMVRSPSRCSDG